MNDDLIRTVAQQIARLDNKAAWSRIEALLSGAGVARRDWMRTRTAIWAERTRQKTEKKCQVMTHSDG